MIRLELPCEDKAMRQLRVGDEVAVYGRIVTARDAAHKMMVESKVIPEIKKLLAGHLIYHCGPVMQQKGSRYQAIAAGPTTSIREEPYQATVLEKYDVRGVIGKGGMGPKTLAACKELGAVYLHAVGGAAVYLAERIVEVVDVLYLDELGSPEAFWVMQVEGFPAVVTMDSHGKSLHDKVSAQSAARRKALLGL